MRVIAGELRGRKLLSPKGDKVRPTSDRVREALFSILGSMDKARILDLFSGTGAVAIEALSRGAKSAILVDQNLRLARRNVEELGLSSSVTFLKSDFRTALKGIDTHVDLIFADPPYRDAMDFLDPIMAFASQRLAQDGELIIEHPKRTELLVEAHGMRRGQQRVYGDTALSFYAHRTQDNRGI